MDKNYILLIVFECLKIGLIKIDALREIINVVLKMDPKLLATIISIITAVVGFIVKKLYSYCRSKKTAQDLKPYFSLKEVKDARKNYVQTKSQNITPTREQEPSNVERFVAATKTITFFMKKAFKEEKDKNIEKFYLVLADSGMGKTTFMINLYMKYTSIINIRAKYKIKLLPFRYGDILERIKDLKNLRPDEVSNTILLLDAFDEYECLIPPENSDGMTSDERFRKCLDEIFDVTRDFYEVVITSRTQYFPGQENEDYELKIPKFGSGGFHKLSKLYISPFSKEDVKKYLNKKYGILKFWNRHKKKIAKSVVDKSPNLMVRPMLLSNIELFVDNDMEFKTTYDIYEILVEKWIEREAEKRKYKKEERNLFKSELDKFSRLVAIKICKKSIIQDRNNSSIEGLALSLEEVEEILSNNNIKLTGFEGTGQSLLTRDAKSNWKFAHKSIYEFMIAREFIENKLLHIEGINLESMDMTEQFLQEKKWDFTFIKGGTFLMGSSKTEVDRHDDETQHKVKLSSFFMSRKQVTIEEFEEFVSEENYITDVEKEDSKTYSWRFDVNGSIQNDKNHPVIYLSWNDAMEYCKWKSKKLNISIKLPTEAQWEYACRAGTTTPFNTGENITTDQANYDGKYPYNKNPKGHFIERTTPVGSYEPNKFGLYDMHGNVYEWCFDWYGDKYYDECKSIGVVENPTGPMEGSYRVLRGGSWNSYGRNCRSDRRNYVTPDYRSYRVGFRLIFVP